MIDSQWKKSWMLPVVAALLGGLLAGAFHHWNGYLLGVCWVSFPHGYETSLSGTGGNATA